MEIQELKHSIVNWRFTSRKIFYLCAGLFALFTYEFLARPYYRPYVYRNNINDFHLADTLGNSLGTFAAIYISLFILGGDKKRDDFFLNTVVLSVIFYELIQPAMGKPIDPWDIIATLIVGCISLGIQAIIYRRPPKT
jgi:hypothetical protein